MNFDFAGKVALLREPAREWASESEDNAPFIVFDDADIEMAVKGAIAYSTPLRSG